MALRCHSYEHYEHWYTGDESTGEPEPFKDRRVLLFDPRLEHGTLSIGERWRLLDAAKQSADLVILRGSSKDFVATVEGDGVFQDLIADTPVVALVGSWHVTSREPILVAPSWSAEWSDSIELDELRHYELATLVRQSKALHRERDCHFRLPSSRIHAEAFIRLADALDDHTDLLRLTDWILPWVDDGTGLLGDNGSLLALLAVVAQEAMRRFGWDLSVSTLHEYPADSMALSACVERFRAQDWERLLFLVTVSSSGALAAQAASVAAEIEVVVLCATDGGAAHATSFCRIPIKRWEAGAEQRCDVCPDSQLLDVDPRTYEVRAKIRRVPERYDMVEARRCAPFWEAADACDAVTLHQFVPTTTGSRERVHHLAVALDVTALLGNDWFRAECLNALRTQPKPDLVLVPDHRATAAITELVREAHDLDADTVVAVPIDALDEAICDRIRAAKTVLIADDVLITASTLVRLRTRVYRASQPDLSIDVWGFVAVMRPPSELESAHAQRPFSAATESGKPQGRLDAGFSLHLPPPSQDGCPWCAELGLLEERLEKLHGEAGEVARARLDRLRKPTGLLPPLLLVGDDDETRTIDSFFGDLRSPAAFAAVSSMAQKQKDGFLRNRGVNTVPVVNVPLAIQAFFDPILLAGLLRTFDRRDLRDTANDEETNRALGEYGMQPGAVAEVGLAAVTGRLPPDAVRGLIDSCDNEIGPTAELILALLEA